jgi:hypothetical protein
MKDKQLKLEEIESFYTLGGVGEGRVQGRGKWRGCSTTLLLDTFLDTSNRAIQSR